MYRYKVTIMIIGILFYFLPRITYKVWLKIDHRNNYKLWSRKKLCISHKLSLCNSDKHIVSQEDKNNKHLPWFVLGFHTQNLIWVYIAPSAQARGDTATKIAQENKSRALCNKFT